MQGLDTAQDKEAVLRAGYCPTGILYKVQPVGQFLVVNHHCTEDHVTVTAQVFGGRVDHDIRAQIEGVCR